MKIAGRVFTPHLLPTLLTVLMLAVTLGLGVWQLHRAEWKGRLIAEWEAQSQKPQIDELPPAGQRDTIKFRKTRLVGRYLSDKSIQIIPRAREGHAGYELITPLKMLSGEVVLVDRGFVASDTHEAIDQPIGAIFAEGEMWPMPKRGWMQPENNPEADQWYWIDPVAIARAKQLEPVYPLILIAETKAVNTLWPMPRMLEAPYANNHLTYAFIWFSLGLALVVIYALSQSQKAED
jgi:surfeit locus 1 family protein